MGKRLIAIFAIGMLAVCVVCACTPDSPAGEDGSSPVTTTTSGSSTTTTGDREGELEFDEWEPGSDQLPGTTTLPGQTTTTSGEGDVDADVTTTTTTAEATTTTVTTLPPIDDEGYGPIVKP